METLQIIKEIIVTLAAASAAIIAFFGLKTWKKQMLGKTEYELSRRFLRAVFETRDAIYTVRHPFISIGEMRKALEEKGLSKKEQEEKISDRESDAAVYERRWESILKATSNLKVEALEAEVLWGGKEIDDILKPLYQHIGKLNANLQLYLSEDKYHDTHQQEKIRDIIYGVREDSGENEFTKQIEKTAEKI